MANVCFVRGKALFAESGNWSSSSQEYGVLLALTDYVPKATHRFVSEVTNELKGGGYERQTLKGRAVVVDETTGKANCVADVAVFDGLSTKQAYRWIVIFRKGDRDSSSDLLVAIDMDRVDLSRQATHSIRWAGQAKNGRVFSLA